MGALQPVNPYPEDWSDRIVGPQARAYSNLPEGYALDDPGAHSFKPAIDGDKFVGKKLTEEPSQYTNITYKPGWGYSIKPEQPSDEWAERVISPLHKQYHQLPEGFELDEPQVHDDTINPQMMEFQRSLPPGFILDEENPVLNPPRSPGDEQPPQIMRIQDIYNRPLPHEGLRTGPMLPRSGLFLSQDEFGNVSPGAIPQFLKDSWEDIKKFMKEGDEQAAFRIAATLASGGFARGAANTALGKGGSEVGVFGGKLIEGGKKTVERTIDDLSDNLVNALKDVKKPDLKAAGQSIKELKAHAAALAKEEATSFPGIFNLSKNELDRMGMTPAEYQARVMQALDVKISKGQRDTFQVLSGGRDPNKPITVDNIVGWLKEAGVENVKVASKGSWDTTYITFEAGGFHHAQVRVSLDGHIARHTRKNLVDAAGSKNWQELVDAIMQKFKLQ